MRKNMMKVALVAAVAAMAGYGVYANQTKEMMSDVMLENVEALAEREESGTGNYDIDEQVTQHSYNGEVYKESKVINCYEGGSFDCTSGKYYRYKNDSGEWGEWTPA